MNNYLAQIPIADAHHHLWDLNGDYPWLSYKVNKDFFLGDYTPLRRNYLPEDYRHDAQKHNVQWTVHIEAEWSRNDQAAETQWLSGIADKYGMPSVIVAHAWFDDPAIEKVLAAHCEHERVRGIRSKPARPDTPAGDDEARGAMDDPRWRRGYALLGKYGLRWDLRVPVGQLTAAAQLVGDYPDIPVALNHTGFPWNRSAEGLAHWRAAMTTLAERPNVYVKLSEFGLKDAPWSYDSNRAIVLAAIDIFGVERCMFASNFPVAGLRISYSDLFDAYKRMVADFTEEEQRQLFHDNAHRFYQPD